MFKRAEVAMLPTKDENSVNIPFLKMPEKQKLVKHLAGGQFRTYLQLGFKSQHLYFLSDEEIKDGNWFINLTSNSIFQYLNKYGVKKGYKYANYTLDLSTCRKIIATTDKSLRTQVFRKDGSPTSNYDFVLPQPSQSFIEKYVEEYNKGNVIREVIVECELKNGKVGKSIPIREQDAIYDIKIAKDNTITIRKVKNSWTKKEHSLNLQYCVSTFAAERGLTPTSEKMKEVNDWVSNWIKENL